MKIGSQSQTLISLSSLVDASKQQQQNQREQLEEKKSEQSREERVALRSKERDELIQQNRDALRKIQDDLRIKNLRKLQQNEEVEEEQSKEVNLNFRESIFPTSQASRQPTFEKLGQLVDIKV